MRLIHHRLAVMLISLFFAAGCNSGKTASSSSKAKPGAKPKEDAVAPEALLESALDLLKDSDRGQENYRIAATRLNQYLAGKIAAEQSPIEPLPAATEEFLGKIIQKQEQIDRIKSEQFTPFDSAHLESCFLARDIAEQLTANVKGDLEKTKKIFQWVVRNVQLVPGRDIQRMPVTPWFTLVLGVGAGEERAWTFMELLRQAGIESVMTASQTEEGSYLWVVAVAVDDKLHLFDTGFGLAIPGKEPGTIATLREVREHPELLRQLDVNEEFPYPVSEEHLKNLALMLESNPKYWCPRMKFLQDRLAGENRVVLHSDLGARVRHFQDMKIEGVSIQLWTLPLSVDEMSTHPQYHNQLQEMVGPYAMVGDMIPARKAHLRGDYETAINTYMKRRLDPSREDLERIPQDINPQMMMSILRWIREDSTYFMGLLKYEQGSLDVAQKWLRNHYLDHYEAGRWQSGARYNLALCAESLEDHESAIEYLVKDHLSAQLGGNLVRAKQLGWDASDFTIEQPQSGEAEQGKPVPGAEEQTNSQEKPSEEQPSAEKPAAAKPESDGAATKDKPAEQPVKSELKPEAKKAPDESAKSKAREDLQPPEQPKQPAASDDAAQSASGVGNGIGCDSGTE